MIAHNDEQRVGRQCSHCALDEFVHLKPVCCVGVGGGGVALAVTCCSLEGMVEWSGPWVWPAAADDEAVSV